MWGKDIKQGTECLVLGRDQLAASLGAFQPPHTHFLCSSRRTSTEGPGATSGSPHTHRTVGQSGGFLLLESGSTEPLGVEENTCLHFHGFDVGLLLFFACGEGRTRDCRQSYRSGSEASPCAWGPCLGIRASPAIRCAYVKPDGLLCQASYHAGPRTRSTAKGEGPGQGWRPKPKGTTEKPGLWFLAHGVSQAHRRV